MNCTLITVTSQPERAATLERSLVKHNWPHAILVTAWHGFGTKLLTVRQYLLDNPDITHFFFADAHDVVALGTMEEALTKLDCGAITFSAEKNCWPDASLERYYEPIEKGMWCYLNSGLYFAPRGLFLALFDENMPSFETDDQLWATNHFLFNDQSGIVLDREQAVFASYSFIADDDYWYGDRLQNVKTGQFSVLVHGNGHTNMDLIIDMI